MLPRSSFITRTPLEDFSLRVSNDYENKMAAAALFPVRMVPKSQGSFYQASNDHLRLRDADAPQGSEANSDDYTYFTTPFTAKQKAWKGLVLSKDARDFDRAVADLDMERAAFNMDVLMIGMEASAHTLATTASNYPSALTTDLSGSGFDTENGDPLTTCQLASDAVFAKCGKRPNVGVLSKKGLDVIKKNANVREFFKYTHGGSVTTEMIAAFLELERIVVSDIIKNTANKGAADSLSTVWGKDMVLAYVAPNAATGLRVMTYGATLMPATFYTKTIDAPSISRDGDAHWVESGLEYVQRPCAVVSDSDEDFIAGYLIKNIYA